ncbi:tRNA epoxyqueuosine(34) reductase QueG [Thorsellia anophelis]|uniref:Epoxyqueuosine reductase n=1 Tax=Thorsellia anophelis DSM 18579 TaxID=1123402 RepID=A0A1I0BCF0_9GAMM|nr:tRNA epoxyqueuosine(34) reductase QueG [Thorsellia anophelis]SET04174.1 epoxyqueuosine reductase [Thorsellia anophelis DSM 18579]
MPISSEPIQCNRSESISESSLIPKEILFSLRNQIETLSLEFGFSEIGFCDLDLNDHAQALQSWLDKQYHGEMSWMENHQLFRTSPDKMVPGALSAITVRLDYLPPNAQFAKVLGTPTLGYVSRYALGKDYHKILRKQLKAFATAINDLLVKEALDFSFEYRPFVDSAPILERPLAAKSGLGFVGKHSLLINHEAGSWFFIGELLTNLPLHLTNPPNQSLEHQSDCGKCQACRTICPTGAIVDDYIVDARRCISYLTIEHKSAIAVELRPLMGNRIYGCDDCQLICPYNKVAPLTKEPAFIKHSQLSAPELLTLLNWSESVFLKETEGSAIRRIGFDSWQRNIAVALGNVPPSAPLSTEIIDALTAQLGRSTLVDEHLNWAIERHLSLSAEVTMQQKRLVRSIEKGLPRDA